MRARIGSLVVVVFVIVTFTVMAATRIGSKDPVRDLAGGTVSEAHIARVEEDYPYLDKPLPVQYVYWLGDLLTGDLGYSYLQSQFATDMSQQRLPPTIFLGFWAIFLGLVVAVPVGIYSAYKRDGMFDRSGSVLSAFFISTSDFAATSRASRRRAAMVSADSALDPRRNGSSNSPSRSLSRSTRSTHSSISAIVTSPRSSATGSPLR